MANITIYEEFKTSLTKMGEELKAVLPSTIEPNKFINVVLIAVQKNPGLLKCNRASLYNACRTCAQDGLIPDGKEAALVKFGETAQYMPMVYGILKKVRNSGELKNITAQVVYEKDSFEFWVDDNGEHVLHKPLMSGPRGKPTHTYAVAKTKEDGTYVEVLTEEQIQDVKKVSKANTGPWTGPFADEMRRKTAIRRLSKRLPMSTDVEQVMYRDDEMYDLDQTEPAKEETTPADQQPPAKKKSRLEEATTTEATEQVEDAQIVEEQVVEEQPSDDNMVICGIIDDIKVKDGETNGKKWRKFGGAINGKYYGTFSKTLFDIMQDSFDNKFPIEIRYEEATRYGKTYQNIIDIKKVESGPNDLPF
ncbi:MAG: recombination and repair protein RecT [Pelotomaculum sp. PtaB.Bin104]|nr:MAG: recombination and repair protein RecT [Pelotomaculum sp. PtaB.Bin104]